MAGDARILCGGARRNLNRQGLCTLPAERSAAKLAVVPRGGALRASCFSLKWVEVGVTAVHSEVDRAEALVRQSADHTLIMIRPTLLHTQSRMVGDNACD